MTRRAPHAAQARAASGAVTIMAMLGPSSASPTPAGSAPTCDASAVRAAAHEP